MNAINFLNLEYVYLKIFDFFRDFDIIALLNSLIHFLNALIPYGVVLCLFLFGVIIYAHVRLRALYRYQEEKFEASKPQVAIPGSAPDLELHKKWQGVQAHINSNNPSDWRLAILEADIMLGDILERMGYQGDSIGEKLKGIDKSDMLTLNDAWEAHKTRNQIAHEGSDFRLNEREAKHVISLYQNVFSEFYHL